MLGRGCAVSVSIFVCIRLFASVTCTVNVDEPAAVGVPLRLPPPESVRPAGSVPAESAQLYGDLPPAAVSAWLYVAPTYASLSGDDVVMVSDANTASVSGCEAVRPF